MTNETSDADRQTEKIIHYYCRVHSYNRNKPLKENKGECEVFNCGMLAEFETEELKQRDKN